MAGARAFTVGTTATLLGGFTKGCQITNTDVAAIFLGGPDVTTTIGTSLAAAGTTTLAGLSGKLWAVSAAGTAANAVKVLAF